MTCIPRHAFQILITEKSHIKNTKEVLFAVNAIGGFGKLVIPDRSIHQTSSNADRCCAHQASIFASVMSFQVSTTTMGYPTYCDANVAAVCLSFNPQQSSILNPIQDVLKHRQKFLQHNYELLWTYSVSEHWGESVLLKGYFATSARCTISLIMIVRHLGSACFWCS